MLSSKSFLCLDFGAGSVKVAEFEVNQAGGLSLKQYGIKPLGIEGSQDSKREKVVLTAIQELLTSRGINIRNCNVCAPGFHVFSKFVKLPPVDTSKVTQIIQYEAQQNVPYPLEETVWDYQIMGATASGEMEVLLVAIKADVVETMFRTSDGAGLKIQLVDVSPAALCNAFRYNYGDLEGCTMLLDIGAKTSNLLFFEKGKVFARSINIGANSITQDFVAEAKMPFAKAEEIKVNEGFVSLGGAYEEPENPHQAAISKIARQVMTRLHIQVNQTIQFYRGQQGGSAPVRLFLAGGASIMPYTAQFFAEKLNVGVEYFNPFRNVTIEPQIDLEDLAKVAHSFGEVVGLGLRNLAQCPVELNLIPKSIRSKQAFDSKKPYFVATVVSLILVVFALGYFYIRTAEIKRESLAVLQRDLEPLKKRADEMDKQVQMIKRAQQELDVYTGYLKDRFFWPEALVEMRNLLVKAEEKVATASRQEVGVWIESFGTLGQVEADEQEEQENAMAGGGMGMMGGGSMMSMMYYMSNPELMKRYFPQMYAMMNKGKTGGGEGGGMGMPGMGMGMPGMGMPGMEDPNAPKRDLKVNTNLVTINVKFRAINLNRSGDTAANGRLAYTVAEEFKNSSFFDSNGTKLSGELENVDNTAKTFTFGMQLKLKNEMVL
ncbi:MAG TPA: type IV pilus assembly protein PilM [Verrucomicrobiae bacterium]|nr:type IV pilus assembly protein PilM [Verrucomicrobiae bacterium]